MQSTVPRFLNLVLPLLRDIAPISSPSPPLEDRGNDLHLWAVVRLRSNDQWIVDTTAHVEQPNEESRG